MSESKGNIGKDVSLKLRKITLNIKKLIIDFQDMHKLCPKFLLFHPY